MITISIVILITPFNLRLTRCLIELVSTARCSCPNRLAWFTTPGFAVTYSYCSILQIKFFEVCSIQDRMKDISVLAPNLFSRMSHTGQKLIPDRA